MNPKVRKILDRVRNQAETLVWWSPSQIARGDDIANDPSQGERAWIVPETTGQFLYEAVLVQKPKIILEFGTSIGYSTMWLAAAASAYGGHVHSIEMKQEKHALAKEHIDQAGLSEAATLHLGKISEILPRLPLILGAQKISMVFMDADRGHYHEYFPMIQSLLSDDATIIADNAGNMNSRMTPFLELLNHEGWQYEIKDMDNGILIARLCE